MPHATVSMMSILWFCLSVFTAESAAATDASCLPASSQVHTTTGVVIRFMTAEQRAAATAQVSRDTGGFLGPLFGPTKWLPASHVASPPPPGGATGGCLCPPRPPPQPRGRPPPGGPSPPNSNLFFSPPPLGPAPDRAF